VLRPLLANNKFSLDLVGKSLVIFAYGQDKLQKYNQWTEDGQKTGYTDETLSIDSTADDTGLFWMIRPVLAILNPETNYIDYLIFSHPIKSIKLTAESGALVTAVVEIAYGTVQVGQLFYAPVDRDINSDGKPDCLDSSIIGSLPWLLKGHGFSYEGGPAPVLKYAQFLTADGKKFLTADGKEFLVRA